MCVYIYVSALCEEINYIYICESNGATVPKIFRSVGSVEVAASNVHLTCHQ